MAPIFGEIASMKKNHGLVLGGILLSFTSLTNAATLDLRYEYTDKTKAHRERALITHRFANGLGFEVEAKWKSGGSHPDRPADNIVTNGSEGTVSYMYKLDKKNVFIPGFNIASSSNSSRYRPYLRYQYNFMDNAFIAARYRFEYIRNTKKQTEDENLHRYDAYISYTAQNMIYEYNYTFYNSDKLVQANKKHGDEHNFILRYKLSKEIMPYFEVGNEFYSKIKNDRQTRYRVGFKYNF